MDTIAIIIGLITGITIIRNVILTPMNRILRTRKRMKVLKMKCVKLYKAIPTIVITVARREKAKENMSITGQTIIAKPYTVMANTSTS